jgi:hypothetical protein
MDNFAVPEIMLSILLLLIGPAAGLILVLRKFAQ